MNVTNSQSGKSRRKKMGSFVQFPCSLLGLWSLNWQKKYIFFQLCADLSKKFESMKAIYIYESERSLYALSENAIVYDAMTYSFADVRV